MTMTFEGFMSAMLKPTYVWRMASGITNPYAERGETPLVRSARTRAANARRKIDDLVLERALVIQDERRCAAVITPVQTEIRCEYPRGHGPVLGRRGTPEGLNMHDQQFDHAAPSRGVWWSEPEEAPA
jgi:hypothetical protein